jgi:hypothetical protein
MEHGNTAIVFMVIAVVSCVLGLVFVGMHCLNKAADRSVMTESRSTDSDRGG